MVRDTGKLPKLLQRRKKYIAAISNLQGDLVKTGSVPDPNDSKKIRFDSTYYHPKLLRALSKKREELETVVAELKREYQTYAAKENDKGVDYFVLFRSNRACNVAKQARRMTQPVPSAVWRARRSQPAP